MVILNVILLSLGSLIALFILTKLMGYRQMSEMSMFDISTALPSAPLPPKWQLPLKKTGGCP